MLSRRQFLVQAGAAVSVSALSCAGAAADAAWNLVKVTRRGCGAACELVKAEGKLPGFKLEVR